MPSSLATALIAFSIALAIAGGGILAVALVGGAGVVWEAFITYAMTTNGVG